MAAEVSGRNQPLLYEGLVANTGLAQGVLTKALCGARALLSPTNCQAKGKTHKITASKRRCKPPETESEATLLNTLPVFSGSNPDINPLTSTKNKNCFFCRGKDFCICQKGADRVETIISFLRFRTLGNTGAVAMFLVLKCRWKGKKGKFVGSRCGV